MKQKTTFQKSSEKCVMFSEFFAVHGRGGDVLTTQGNTYNQWTEILKTINEVVISRHVSSIHGDLYYMLLGRVYGRYGVLDAEVVGSGKGGRRRKSGARDRRTGAGVTAGQGGGGRAGRRDGGASRGGRWKLVPAVGYVSEYRGFYGEGMGGQAGGGTYNPFWVVQYP